MALFSGAIALGNRLWRCHITNISRRLVPEHGREIRSLISVPVLWYSPTQMLRLASRDTTAVEVVAEATTTIPAPDPASISTADQERAAEWYTDKPCYQARFSCPTDRFPAAKAVSVVFFFEHWNSSLHPMQESPNGTWEVFVSLPRGTYMYRFVVDGHFYLDHQAPVQTTGPDGHATSLTWIEPLTPPTT